jgi:L-ornithine Nalpha-acyltransferase
MRGSITGPDAVAMPWARPATPLGRLGALEVRLARNPGEVARAQALRHRVFRAGAARGGDPFDADAFDAVCDHLLVLDGDAPVGTCRLLRRDVAERHFGFYSAGEFDLGPLLAAHPEARFLELGRSCVAPSHRAKRTVELLWHGAWSYALRTGADVLFGCASLPGTDPERLAGPLGLSRRRARAEPGWRVRAAAGRGVALDRGGRPDAGDEAAAWRALPPLLKGYLRLGALISEEAVVDPDFGTVDVLVLLRVAGIAPRYLAHFGASAERHAAEGHLDGRELASDAADAIAERRRSAAGQGGATVS